MSILSGHLMGLHPLRILCHVASSCPGRYSQAHISQTICISLGRTSKVLSPTAGMHCSKMELLLIDSLTVGGSARRGHVSWRPREWTVARDYCSPLKSLARAVPSPDPPPCSLFLFFKLFIFWPHLIVYRISVPCPGIEPEPPALEAQSLNHWTTRELPMLFIFKQLYWDIIYTPYSASIYVYNSMALVYPQIYTTITTILEHFHHPQKKPCIP